MDQISSFDEGYYIGWGEALETLIRRYGKEGEKIAREVMLSANITLIDLVKHGKTQQKQGKALIYTTKD